MGYKSSVSEKSETTSLKPQQQIKSKLLDRSQAAAYLAISIRKLDHLTKDGSLPKVMIGAKPLYLLDDLNQFISSCRQG
jgi:hypothetical protein